MVKTIPGVPREFQMNELLSTNIIKSQQKLFETINIHREIVTKRGDLTVYK